VMRRLALSDKLKPSAKRQREPTQQTTRKTSTNSKHRETQNQKPAIKSALMEARPCDYSSCNVLEALSGKPVKKDEDALTFITKTRYGPLGSILKSDSDFESRLIKLLPRSRDCSNDYSLDSIPVVKNYPLTRRNARSVSDFY